MFICDECVGLCNDIVLGQDPIDYARALESLSAKSTDELIALKTKVTARIPQLRQLRDLIDTVGHEADPARADKPEIDLILKRR